MGGCVLGIEPNEHQKPRFQGKYDNHTHLPENPERSNSPNVLPMSQCCWDVRFVVLMVLSVFPENWENSGIEVMIL